MKRFNNILNRLFSCNVALLTIPLLLIIPNVCLCVTEEYTLAAICANIMLPLGIYILVLTAFKRTYIGALCLLPAMILCAFQIVLLFLYHGSIIAIDMFINVATTNAAEASELLESLTDAMATVLILYLPVIIWAVFRLFKPQTASQSWTKDMRAIGTTCTLIGIVTVFIAYKSDSAYRMSRHLFPVNVCCNMYMAVDRIDRIAQYHSTSATFRYGASSTHPSDQKEIYIMVIGETSRAGNFALAGYDRNTNPRLKEQKNVIMYPKTLSESNTTHKSVPMLMSALTSENYDSIYYRKSIITAFKEAGYHTAYFSAQKRNHSFIDFFGEEADTTDFITYHNEAASPDDLMLINRVETYLNDNSDTNKLFIVLHTYGSHFRYDDRYATNAACFKPDNCAIADKAHRTELINAYDNTIRQVDQTLSSLITLLDNQHDACTALVYTSDHGEDIFDDNRERFLHASPTPTYWQLHVPLIIWMSDDYISSYPDKSDSALEHKNQNVSSSRSLSPTILDMAGIKCSITNPSMSLTSTYYTEPERKYLTDYNEGVPLTNSGLKSTDFAMLSARDISQ